jgi:non-heme chloroperoxidase
VLVQILAGRGLSAATCAVDPAPSRGVLPLPLAALKAASPVLVNPANRHRAVTLTFDQFRFGFANAISEEEAHELYEQFHVAGSGIPLFQAALANLNPGTEVNAAKTGDDRGPLLVVSGERDHQAPHAIAGATYQAQKKNEHFPTEFVK